MRDIANCTGLELHAVEHFWRSMGFADVDPDENCFTQQDCDAIKSADSLLGENRLESDGVTELLRAQSYTMDRLVLWQLESLVSDVAARFKLDDSSARLVVLSRIGELIDPLAEQLTYSWRRHLAALVERTDAEVGRRGPEEAGPDFFPLIRSLGFVDIVSFTQHSQSMGRQELTSLLQDFEYTARDVVTSRGARVVKTIGDAVMYIADDLTVAADVVTSLVEELQSGPGTLLVRASLVEGRVVSHSGDVFGPTVNLASRLVDTAEPGGIRMDEPTARALQASPAADQYEMRQCHEVVAKGLGQITPWSLARSTN